MTPFRRNEQGLQINGCDENLEQLVELARKGASPRSPLAAHIKLCAACAERWEREQMLSSRLRLIARGWAGSAPPAAQREILLREFASRQSRPGATPWVWALAMAAALLLAVWAAPVRLRTAPVQNKTIAGNGSRSTGRPSTAVQNTAFETTAVESVDASGISSDSFIAVPFTPPLAQGELVRVIHAELYPEALTRMGIAFDPAWSKTMQAIETEVVVGEDGLPRALRIADTQVR